MKKLTLLIILILLGVGIVSWVLVYNLDKNNLEVVFFDVGQGDSIYIEFGKNQILIDGGPDSKVLEGLGEEMPFYDRKIELVILTHPDHDHLFGLLEVLKSYEVENILWTGVVKDTQEYQEWLKLIKEEGANVLIAKKGQRINMGPSIVLDVIYPLESLEGKEANNTNNTSIVAKLVHGSVSFLFPGDIEEKVEKELPDIDSDILKVCHHGSRTSSSAEFLEKVSPVLAVIQVGENSYGHPSQEVLARFEEFGIQVLRTDKEGNVGIISTGDNFYFKK